MKTKYTSSDPVTRWDWIVIHFLELIQSLVVLATLGTYHWEWINQIRIGILFKGE